MNETNKKLIKTTCPICSSGQVKMVVNEMPNEDKKRIEESLNNAPSNTLFYKGAKWVFQNSIGALASLNGLPYSLGKEAAKALTDIADAVMEDQQSETRELLESMSDTIYLVEIVCDNCGYVLNRYYTRTSG